MKPTAAQVNILKELEQFGGVAEKKSLGHLGSNTRVWVWYLRPKKPGHHTNLLILADRARELGLEVRLVKRYKKNGPVAFRYQNWTYEQIKPEGVLSEVNMITVWCPEDIE